MKSAHRKHTALAPMVYGFNNAIVVGTGGKMSSSTSGISGIDGRRGGVEPLETFEELRFVMHCMTFRCTTPLRSVFAAGLDATVF
jgi:hypothetical protein